MHATFRQLSTFETIARLGSYTKAAEELHLTQPTVSAQIAKLEDSIDVLLFEQVGRKIHLTEDGLSLLQMCREVFDAVSHFEMKLSERRGLTQGKLRLAAVTTSQYFIPRILGDFCREYPGIDVTLEVTNREKVLHRLYENLDDLYIFGTPPDDKNLETIPFRENQLVIIAEKNHPLAIEKNITFSKLAEESFVIREKGSGTRSTIERIFKDRGLDLKIRMELGGNEAVKQAVAGGLGVAIMSQDAINDEILLRDFALLDVVEFPIQRQWHLITQKGKELSPIAKTFMAYISPKT